MSAAIEVNKIAKKFVLYQNPRDRLLEALSLSRSVHHTEFWALQDISFTVEASVSLGILGVNGSGKSTLLKIIANYLPATSGSVKTRGRIATILELGTGFNPEFSGIDNVFLYGGLMGLGREEMKKKMPEIEAFAGIGDFIQRPMRTYSSGMYMRLAFACTTHMEPEILIIDEALAVGDMAFQHQCINRIKMLQKKGVTILFVSHSLGAVKSLCQEAILLDGGRLAYRGTGEEVANYYHAMLARLEEEREAVNKSKPMAKPSNSQSPRKNSAKVNHQNAALPPDRAGTGEVRIESVVVLDHHGQPLEQVAFDQEVEIQICFKARQACTPKVVGYIIRDRFGVDLLGTNTAVENLEIEPLDAGDLCQVAFRLKLPLVQGSYSITAAVGHDPERPLYSDWWDNACVFEMLPPDNRRITGSKVYLPVEVSITKEGC